MNDNVKQFIKDFDLVEVTKTSLDTEYRPPVWVTAVYLIVGALCIVGLCL